MKRAGLMVGLCLLSLSSNAQQQDLKTPLPVVLDAWKKAASPGEKAEVRRLYGPFDAAFTKALQDQGEDLKKRGDYSGAKERYRFCSDIAQAAQDNLQSSLCLQLTGGIDRLEGRYAEAEAHYRGALQFASLPGGNSRIPFVLNNLASVYGAESRYLECAELLQRAILFNQQAGITSDASPYQNLAIVYGLQGDLARAMRNFLIALQIYERGADTAKLALTHHNIGELQIKQGNFEAAALELETARALGDKAGDKSQVAQTLGELGHVRDAQNRPADALLLLNQSLQLCKDLGFRAGYVDALTNLGNFHAAHGDYGAARLRFEEARQIAADELHDGYNLGVALRGLGLVAEKQKDYRAAVSYASAAVENAHAIGDLQGEWQAEALAGLSRRGLGDATLARAAFTRAIALIERQRGLVAGAELDQQRFFEQAVYPYRQLAELELSAGNVLASLQTAERARSRVLLDIVAAGPEQIATRMTESERAEETVLRVNMTLANNKLSRVKPAERPAAIDERDHAWQSYESFLGKLYVTHPDLRTARGESPAITEAELTRLLPDSKTALIEYLCSEQQTLMFVALRDAATGKLLIRTHRIAIGAAQLQKQADAYRSSLESRDPGFRAAAERLHALLLQPAAGDLKGRTRIYLVPDGPLSTLPFQALSDPSGRYWIQDVTVSYAPSLTFLRDQSLAERKANNFSSDLFVLGDPTRADMPSIPALRDQAVRIGNLYGPRSPRVMVRVGAAATEAEFKTDAPGAQVIHLAAHGIVDTASPLHSRVMLAAASGGPVQEDGWMEAWEIMRMNLNADLVVLSACETARGRNTAGEGLVGLTWALFVAGARTAVVSQWRVESGSTTELMVGLHQRLRTGRLPAEALRGSVLALMKEERYSHPMYWAGFISAGLR